MVGLLPSNGIFASASAEAILRRSGLHDLDEIFRRASDARRRHSGRAVWSVELEDEDGPFTAFIKLEWGTPRLWPRLTDLRSGQAFQSLIVREWRGIAQLEELGLRVPERLALFQDGRIFQRAAVILRAVEPEASLADMIRNGQWGSLSETDQRRLIETALETLARIHAAGLGWRGAACKHIFPERNLAGGWTLWLIDCEGVHRSRSQGTLSRDSESFVRSFKRARASQQAIDLARFCKTRLLAAAE